MGVLDSFVFLLSADEDDAVKGIERTGQAFEDLKDKGQSDSKAVADSFEEAANKIGKVANDIGATLSGVEGAAELSSTLAGTSSDFIDLGNQVNSTGEGIVQVANNINSAFGEMSSVGELTRLTDQATLDFINLGEAAGGIGSDISNGIVGAITSTISESEHLSESVNRLGNTTSVDSLTSKIKELIRTLITAGNSGTQLGEDLVDTTQEAQPRINKLTDSIRNMMNSLNERVGLNDFAKGFIATAAAGMSLNAVLDNTAALLEKVRDAETVGVDIGDYDALSRTFTSLGVDAEGFRDSMIDLNEAMGEAAADAESGKAKSFQTFGVSLKDSTGQIKATDEALLELADSMSGMSKQQATFQIKQLGITDNKVIAAMLSGRKELERMLKVQKEYGTLSQADAAKVKQFSGAVSELKTMTGHFADEMTIALAPAMTMTVEGVEILYKFFSELFSFLADHEGLIAGILLPVAVVVLPMLTAALWSAATAVWAFLAPLLPFIAIALALGLVIDDLWTYFKGGESVIGDLAKKFTWLDSFLQNTKELFLDLIEVIKQFADNPMKVISGIGDSVKQGWEDAKDWVGLGDDDEEGSSSSSEVSTKESSEVNKKETSSKETTNNETTNSKVNNETTNTETSNSKVNEEKVSSKVNNETTNSQVNNKTTNSEVNNKTTYSTEVITTEYVNKGLPSVNKPKKTKVEDPLAESMKLASSANIVLKGAAAAPQIPSSSVVNNTRGGNTVQQTNDIKITVPNGDAETISQGVQQGLNGHLDSTMSEFDDGRSH